MKYLALDLGNRRKKKTFDKCCNSSSIIALIISKLQEGKSETSGAATVQRRETPGPCRYLTGKSHGFCQTLAYPLLNKKAEDMVETYAIHLTFFCVDF